MNECCKKTLKKFIEYYNELGYIDLHGDITAYSEIEDFIKYLEEHKVFE
jgi:hypothetical protein